MAAKVDRAAAKLDRASMIGRLGSESFDIAVIGGGINGAAVARDAAMRGLRVALVDKGDFASATSSRSSKLIHGGLRYLPQGHLRLVYQALGERERLRRITAPHLVGPIKFLMPFFSGARPRRIAISFGLALYDLMARTPRPERHQRLGAAQVRELEPGLRSDRLVGGAIYYDGSGDDARITLENALDAAYHGAVIANYAALEGLAAPISGGRKLRIRDLESGVALGLRAGVVVNAAGSWIDEIRRMERPGCPPIARLTKGVHLVVRCDRIRVRHALVLTDGGGRIIFVIPTGQYALIGTTDTDFDGDRDRIAADADDIDYLLGIINHALPDVAMVPSDIAYTLAGLRVLPLMPGRASPSAVAREELIEESPSGMLTIAGGKLTTHRAIAEKVVDRAVARLGRTDARCPTYSAPLPGARPLVLDGAPHAALAPSILEMLKSRYGTRWPLIAEIASQQPGLAEPLSDGAPAIGAEVVFAARYELARSVADFLVRRTAMVWRAPDAACAAAPAAARLMAAELGWGPARSQREVDSVAELIGRARPPKPGAEHIASRKSGSQGGPRYSAESN